ncbi:hypothetical protein EV127DRAFT_414062 [Xylaria flabelliformis]|nr:hypothetical protein EV127DRAFT_414062 [Xylaria flabelliformis]
MSTLIIISRNDGDLITLKGWFGGAFGGQQNALYWLCKYCHHHHMTGGLYEVEPLMSTIAKHLEQQKKGQGYDKGGKIEPRTPRNHTSILARMQQSKKLNVPRSVANAVA